MIFYVFVFLRPYLWHMEGPRLGVESKLQLLAYASAAAMLDLSHICDIHHSLWKHRILNPLGKARDQTHILMDTSQVPNPLSHNGDSLPSLLMGKTCALLFMNINRIIN